MLATLSFVLGTMTAAQTNALIAGIISVGFGVLILLVPRALNYIVALYLLVIGTALLARAFS